MGGVGRPLPHANAGETKMRANKTIRLFIGTSLPLFRIYSGHLLLRLRRWLSYQFLKLGA